MLAGTELQRHLIPIRAATCATPAPRRADRRPEEGDARRCPEFYEQFYGASNGEFVVVGQFDPAEVEKLAAELFGDWKSPSHYERLLNAYHKVDPDRP